MHGMEALIVFREPKRHRTYHMLQFLLTLEKVSCHAGSTTGFAFERKMAGAVLI